MLAKQIANASAKLCTLRGHSVSAPKVEKCNQTNHQTLAAPYDYKLCFRNGFGRSVYAIHRNGFVVEIPHVDAKDIGTDTITVSSCHIANAFVNLDVTSLLDAPHASDEIKVMSKSDVRRDDSARYANFSSHFVTFEIDKATLQEKGSVYVEELSLVLTIEDPNTIIHPDSDVGKAKRASRIDVKKQGALDIEIVDPDQKVGLKWFRWLDTAMPIEPLRMDSRAPGIYVTTLEGNKVISKRYALEDAAKLQLFDTMDEAVHYDLVAEMKREHDVAIQELALKTTKVKNGNLKGEKRLTRVVNEMKVKLLKSEKKAKELMDKLTKRKIKREEDTAKIKDEYDRKSARRKDTSEGIKVFGMVLGGLATLGVVIKALFF